jgi:hypothetical protein
VYGLDDTADECAAVRVFQEAKGLDDHDARQPFGLLYWHHRPFLVQFASEELAGQFVERPRACGSCTADWRLKPAPRMLNRQDKALPQKTWDGIPLTQ